MMNGFQYGGDDGDGENEDDDDDDGWMEYEMNLF
jgi:hypothetical protein